MRLSRIIIFVLFLCISVQAVHALCIGPAITKIAYEPHKTHSLVFTVSLCGDRPIPITIATDGELGKYITITEKEFYLHNAYQFVADLYIPELKKPGLHIGKIIATQKAEKLYGRATVGALASVVSRIEVRVPYPKKYAEIELEISDVTIGRTAYFTVIFHNYGTQTINFATGKLLIYSPDGNIIAEVPLTEIYGIPGMSDAELYAEWQTSGIKAGRYRAEALVTYDNLETNTSSTFKVGELKIEIENISPQKFESGTISKFLTLLKNLWGATTEAYIEYKLRNFSAILVGGVSATKKLNPWSSTEIEAFLDLSKVGPGSYLLDLIAHYEGKKSARTFVIEVVKELIEEKPKPTFSPHSKYIFVILLSTIILLIYYIFKKTRK